MRFDELVVHLGEFGPYQKKIYFLLCYPVFVCAFQKLVWVFVAANPFHRCWLPEDEISNLTNPYYLSNEILNISIPWDEANHRWDSCHKYQHYIATNESILRNSSALVKCDRWIYDRSQYTTSAITDFDLVCDRQWISALTVSLQMGGEFLGGLVLGILSDKYGRRLIMVISAVMLPASGVVSSFANSAIMIIICRVFIGFWTPGVFLSAYVIGMEFVGPSKRVFAGIVTQYFFALGYLLIAVIAYFIREWRYLQITLSLPTLLIFSYHWLVPESVRWMLTQNKKSEAIKAMRKIAKKNKRNLPEELLSNEIDVENEPTGSLRDLMRYPNLRKRTFIVVYCWFVNSCVYYGFSFNTSNLGGNDYINFGLAATVEFPAYTICMLTLDRYGRRIPLSTALILSGISLLITPFVPSDYNVVVIILAMFGKFAITVSYAIIYMFSAEVFPTTVRSASYGFSSTCGRLGAMLAPFMLLLHDYWLPLPQLLFSILALSSGLFCLLLPETHGRELPETIKDGENFTRKMVSKDVVEVISIQRLTQGTPDSKNGFLLKAPKNVENDAFS